MTATPLHGIKIYAESTIPESQIVKRGNSYFVHPSNYKKLSENKGWFDWIKKLKLVSEGQGYYPALDGPFEG